MKALKKIQALKAAPLVFSIENRMVPTEAEIAIRRSELESIGSGLLEHAGILVNALAFLSFIALMLCASAAAVLPQHVNAEAIAWLLSGGLLAACACYAAMRVALRYDEAWTWLQRAKQALRPLSEITPEPERLREILALCAISPAAETYRQDVIAQNREFYKTELIMFAEELRLTRLRENIAQRERVPDELTKQLYTP